MACHCRAGDPVGRIGEHMATPQELCSTPENNGLSEARKLMADDLSRVDGARVLADLNALRAIGAYKTGVHKPTFSEPHMRSLAVADAAVPRGGPRERNRRHRQRHRNQHEARAEIAGGLASGKPELCGLARWTARRGLCARSRTRHQSGPEHSWRGRGRGMVRRGRPFRQFSRQPVLCRCRHRSGNRRRPRPQQRQDHA